jgi:hypothetical protein
LQRETVPVPIVNVIIALFADGCNFLVGGLPALNEHSLTIGRKKRKIEPIETGLKL